MHPHMSRAIVLACIDNALAKVEAYSTWSREWLSTEKDDAWLSKQLAQAPREGSVWDGDWEVAVDHPNTDKDGWG